MKMISLYIHLPWCVRKCPYCDFNSHENKQPLPEAQYIAALLQDLDEHVATIQHRPLMSIFFGGGTPSLFSANAIGQILHGVDTRLTIRPETEITMEANPGTVEQKRFQDFRLAGVNRLSLGIQSLQDPKLKLLGRIHDSETALRAIAQAKAAGFRSINLDLMFGLPTQSTADALADLQLALAQEPDHLSWYQLTIEPNTVFHRYPPTLPVDDVIWDMQLQGQDLLGKQGFKQYEVSAYSRPQHECQHNRNYWEFGDYLGIGAGAHSKITQPEQGLITRHWQVKQPGDYLNSEKQKTANQVTLTEKDLIFEFMLNALRLTAGVPLHLFSERTRLALTTIEPVLSAAKRQGLLVDQSSRLCATELGKRFLNDVIQMFLP
ncbi:MAG: YggW family oxidoreductase [Gammaproteobacteria bacterium RIFCSPHIGHO2_12_FULL_45_9]|nr:MAG: YggW family oxidoreductase [Gammaproteobacteria bacterium RIFCSPHIGHO2_12_FULL_45_9]